MSKCLVVPRTSLEKMPFWSRFTKTQGVLNSGLKLSKDEIQELLELIRKEQRYFERRGEDNVEEKPEWQQVIFYALVVQNSHFFIYKRNKLDNSHEDTRLSSKLSAGVGGHIEPHDKDPFDSLPRELDEELSFTKGTEVLPVPKDIDIVGVIKDERGEIGTVHIGLVCIVRVEEGIDVNIKGDEGVEGWMTTPEEYDSLIKSGKYSPEGWTEILVEKFAKPLLL